MMFPKAPENDLLGRFREVISDPLNLLIERVPLAGIVEANDVYLHNGVRVPIGGDGAYYGRFSHLLVINRGVRRAPGRICVPGIAQMSSRGANYARTWRLLGPLFNVAQII